jgi:hypothetical protein
MLLGNYSILNRNTGTSTGNEFTNPIKQVKATALPRFWVGEHAKPNETNYASRPAGRAPPHCIFPALKSGGMSAFVLRSNATCTGTIHGAREGEAAAYGSSTCTATGELIVSGEGTSNGFATCTGDLIGIVEGVGSASGVATCTASGSGVGELAASAIGVATCTGDLTAIGSMDGLSTTAASLSPSSLAAAVWSSAEGSFLYALARNKVITDPVAGTMTVYAEDGTTVLYVADLFQDAAGATPYAGAGAERREKFE